VKKAILAILFLVALALVSACGMQQQPVAESGVTMARAQAICSTLAVARNTPDYNLLDQIMTTDVATTDPFGSAPMTSLDQLKQFYLGTQSGFPDFSIRHDKIWLDGDDIIAHWTVSATHQGQWYGMDGTGKNVTISGISVMTVTDGKVTEQSSYFDLLSVAKQIGARLQLPKDGA
jgi:steroid delta-isomerase-like uncharacterized protein